MIRRVLQKKTYSCAIKYFQSFIDKETMDISELTSFLMRRWEEWLREKYGNDARSVSAYPACIAVIHGQARKKYNNEETGQILIHNPFQFYKPPRQKKAGHRALKTEVIQQMIDLRGELKGRERMGVDVFLISFSLMEMNAPDLYTCTDKDCIIHYKRTKTRDRRDDEAEMFVKMDDMVQDVFSEYLSSKPDRTFRFTEMYTTYEIFGENVNEGLDKFRKRIGFKEKITLYWARHSWASIAYKAGVDKGIINDCLCHVDREMKTTDIYIDKEWFVMWNANAKVLKQFKWDDNKSSNECTEKKKRAASKQIPPSPMSRPMASRL